jgi:hypothetical protein
LYSLYVDTKVARKTAAAMPIPSNQSAKPRKARNKVMTKATHKILISGSYENEIISERMKGDRVCVIVNPLPNYSK